MTSAKTIFKDWRVILVLLAIVVSFLAIQPNIIGLKGVQLIYLSPNSFLGNLSARGLTSLTTGSIITGIDGIPVSNPSGFYSALNKTAVPGSTVVIHYGNEIFPFVYSYSSVDVSVTNQSPLNSTYMRVEGIPSTQLNYGLDIIGGTQITIVPNETSYNGTVLSNIESVLQTRLNTYGISGISISQIQAISGKSFILVSMPNVGEAQALSLIQNQGIFYAKIGNQTIFNSTNKTEKILTVCLSAGCPFNNPGEPYGVYPSNGVYSFSFGIETSKQAALNFQAATRNLSVISAGSNAGFLSKPIVMYLNGKQISSLEISSALKGQFTQDIIITGGGTTQQQALASMKTLQSVLESGSLPVPVKIVSIQSVSPTAGSEFVQQIYILLLAAFIGVSLMVFLRYKDYRIASVILLTSIAEIIIVFGIAALIKWTLDIPSMAGIIASIGISVDDQIIITDEIKRGSAKEEYTVTSKRIKRAFFIIFVSFFSFSAIMFPLLFSSASLFTGFALTTILASLVGLIITRPAYARIVAGMFGSGGV